MTGRYAHRRPSSFRTLAPDNDGAVQSSHRIAGARSRQGRRAAISVLARQYGSLDQFRFRHADRDRTDRVADLASRGAPAFRLVVTRRSLLVRCIAMAGLVAMIGMARSQDFDVGREAGRSEYLANCANCHGADGKGAGPHSAALKKRPADLTLLATHNHGVFPVSQVYRLVDGRGLERRHLGDEMPIWGCRQSSHRSLSPTRQRHPATAGRKPPADGDLEAFMNMTCDPETTIQRRIMSIVAYLSYIQAK
jgi:mono/diheme cytochrome c family protein